MTKITGSVGHGGKNVRSDVKVIQNLLNNQQLPDSKPLVIDGIVGKRTVERIKTFQRAVVKMKFPDGRVDPGGKTLRALAGASPKARQITSGKWAGNSARWSQDKKLRSLNSDFGTKVKKLVEALEGRQFKPKIFYGWRSVEVQLELYRKGRTKVKFSFHNATLKDGTPNAYAVDIIDSRYAWNDAPETKEFWKALGEEAKKLGLYWGGDWTSFKDWAHVQMHPNSELGKVKKESGL